MAKAINNDSSENKKLSFDECKFLLTNGTKKVKVFSFDTKQKQPKVLLTIENKQISLFDKVQDIGLIKYLYAEKCQPSKFGIEKRYEYDESVRCSRETKDFSIDNVDMLVPAYYMSKYKCELYKLVIYGPGDFFTMHTDTPRENLKYSMVFTLDSDYKGGEFYVYGLSNIFLNKKIIIFKPYIPYEVCKVTSGYRISILFNIYKRPVPKLSKENLTIDVDLILKFFNTFNFEEYKKKGLMNLFFSHPFDDEICSILDNRNIHYEEVATLESFDTAFPIDKFLSKLDDANEDNNSNSAELENKLDYEEGYEIDYVLCKGLLSTGEYTHYHGYEGNSSPIADVLEAHFYRGYLIMLSKSNFGHQSKLVTADGSGSSDEDDQKVVYKGKDSSSDSGSDSDD